MLVMRRLNKYVETLFLFSFTFSYKLNAKSNVRFLTLDLTGDLTLDLTGDLTLDVTGDLTGDLTLNLTGGLTLNNDVILHTNYFRRQRGPPHDDVILNL